MNLNSLGASTEIYNTEQKADPEQFNTNRQDILSDEIKTRKGKVVGGSGEWAALRSVEMRAFM